MALRNSVSAQYLATVNHTSHPREWVTETSYRRGFFLFDMILELGLAFIVCFDFELKNHRKTLEGG